MASGYEGETRLFQNNFSPLPEQINLNHILTIARLEDKLTGSPLFSEQFSNQQVTSY